MSGDDTNEGKCQSIVWNLLTALEEMKDDMSAVHYLREWDQTKRCEKFFSLQSERNDIENHVSTDAYKRILQFNETAQDENRAAQTLFHYRLWHSKRLYESLSRSNTFYYWTFYKSVKLLEATGLVTVGFGGIAGAFRHYKRLAAARDANVVRTASGKAGVP